MNILQDLMSKFPRTFFLELHEEMDAAFATAVHVTDTILKAEAPERANLIAQVRHQQCEERFRKAATSAGLDCDALPTDPRGSHYSIVRSGNFVLVRGNVQDHQGLPRATKFRQEAARLNSWLARHQFDLFDDVSEPPINAVCGMVVATVADAQESIPAFLGLGFPLPDMSGWSALFSIDQLIGMYSEVAEVDVVEKPLDLSVPDKAFPRIKRLKVQ